MSALISVIVPIYKVEAYLRQCLDTIVGQTYKNLEIILIDDGSPDKCPQICDEYAGKDNRIRVIHQKNGGLSAARNAGLDIATGDYIAFVDSDDWVELNMYETLLANITNTNADIVTCGIYYNFPNYEVGSSVNDEVTVEYSNEAAIALIPDVNANIRFEVWNKIFRRSLIAGLRFKEGQIYEDVFFDRHVFMRSKKIVRFNKNLYHYRVSRPGNTNSSFKMNRFSIFEELDDFISDMQEAGMDGNVKIFKRYSALTIISHYISATDNNAPKFMLEKLKNIFDDKYKKMGILEKFSNIKLILFSLSPAFYVITRKLFR